jgi:hypothetical protein
MNIRIVLVLLFFTSCSTNTPETAASTFSKARDLALIDAKLPEASGMAASVVNRGSIWVVNDSGNPAEVYLIDTTAHVTLTCKLSVENRDWEEVLVGPGPKDGKTYVYVGEIGDNNAVYDTKYIYRFEEPILRDATDGEAILPEATDGEAILPEATDGEAIKEVNLVDTLKIQMSDGKRDTETMLIDPFTKDLYIISKREDSVGVYKVAQPFTKDVMIAQKVAKIPFFKIVAGQFSPDGTEVILKDYDHIYYWKRKKDEPLETVLMRKPERLPYDREAQGESLTWKMDGSGYYTLSETNPGKPAYLKFYKRM